ncbi:MAG TPA: chemotaxis protein CheR [bacterium]|nr:chemotaxis protein CheR [bacterium]
MVTFCLGGKDYGIDIMKVKEISKETSFTFVPNTPPYVRGVHNLRGEIIPVIDFRKMFYLPSENGEYAEEELIILRLENERILGAVVDSIDKVLSVSEQRIQPPHPLFGDINIEYIAGVVEEEGRLFIILDVDRIFNQPVAAEPQAGTIPEGTKVEVQEDPVFKFIVETLKTFSAFHVSDFNLAWTKERYVEWQKRRESEGKGAQIQSIEDSTEFLKDFYSDSNGRLWGADYKDNLLKLLPETASSTVNIWNPGCGGGYESYSVAVCFCLKYPQSKIKVWAQDIDLMGISTAASLFFTPDSIPQYMLASGFMEEKPKGYTFTQNIKDNIFFEYHDILHRNEYPQADCIVARDVLSFVDPRQQQILLGEFFEKLKGNGILILGENEVISMPGWYRLVEGNVAVYRPE